MDLARPFNNMFHIRKLAAQFTLEIHVLYFCQLIVNKALSQ